MAWGGRAHAAARTRGSSRVQRTSPPDKGTGEPANYGPGRRAASPPGQCTVIVAWPVLPSAEARSTAIPAERAHTNANVSPPKVWSSIVVLSGVNHDTERPDRRLHAESSSSATMFRVSVLVAVSI